MPYSNISSAIRPADKTAIVTNIGSIRSLLSFLVNLTADERRSLSKMGDSTFSYVDKALAYALANPMLVPAYVSVADWQKDQDLWKDLRDILIQIETLSEGVSDTKMAVGVESKKAADVFYAAVQIASQQNVVGAETIFDDLSTFYAKASQDVATPASSASGTATTP
jgi:hypothetical protein